MAPSGRRESPRVEVAPRAASDEDRRHPGRGGRGYVVVDPVPDVRDPARLQIEFLGDPGEEFRLGLETPQDSDEPIMSTPRFKSWSAGTAQAG